MPSEPEMREKRRGERVLIRIPVEVQLRTPGGPAEPQTGETVVVSRYGALLRTASQLKPESRVTLTQGFSHESDEFRVVWVSESPAEGFWEAGVEAVHPRDDFWGILFPFRPPGS